MSSRGSICVGVVILRLLFERKESCARIHDVKKAVF